MKRKFDNRNILKLFSNLKTTEKDYPVWMMRSRRNMYVEQAAAMTASLKTNRNRKNKDYQKKGMGKGGKK